MKKRTSWQQEIKRLGVDSDAAIARRLKIPPQAVRKRRISLGIPRGSSTRTDRRINWKKESKHLGVESDVAIAQRLGISTSAVQVRRRELGISPAPVEYETVADWESERANLGILPDAEIARRLGVSRERVRQMRGKQGIPRPPRAVMPAQAAAAKLPPNLIPEPYVALARQLRLTQQAMRALMEMESSTSRRENRDTPRRGAPKRIRK